MERLNDSNILRNNTNILDMELMKTPIRSDIKNTLLDNNINTVGDLVSISKEDLQTMFEAKNFNRVYSYLSIFVHRIGLVLKNEYEYLGLPDDLASLNLDLLGLPLNILNELNAAGFSVLGELLSLEEYELLKLCNNHLDFTDLEIIKEKIRSMDLVFKSSDSDIEKTRIKNKLGYIKNYVNYGQINDLENIEILLDAVVEYLKSDIQKDMVK